MVFLIVASLIELHDGDFLSRLFVRAFYLIFASFYQEISVCADWDGEKSEFDTLLDIDENKKENLCIFRFYWELFHQIWLSFKKTKELF